MAFKCVLLCLSCFLCIQSLFVAAQNEVTSTLEPSASPSVYTTAVISSTGLSNLPASSSTASSALTPSATNSRGRPSALAQGSLRVSKSFTIENATQYDTPCWYPVSGTYGRLPRVLFYLTLVFALFGRAHEWLIAGALAAALTYSGSAAIHACLLIWRGPSAGELDFTALLAILSTSCLITVPLLDWSKTLRNLGVPKQDQREDSAKGATRSILVWWGLLVAVGFLSLFVVLKDPNNPAKVSIYNFSNLTEIACAPRSGEINYSAGQIAGWQQFYITKEFLNENNCVEACSTDIGPFWAGGALFRSNEDLRTLTKAEVDQVFEGVLTSSKKRGLDSFVGFYLKFGLFVVPYFLAQGIWAVLFGRATPAQARFKLYDIMTDLRLPWSKHTKANSLQRWIAKVSAMTAYLWAILILLLCVPVFVLNIFAAESMTNGYPQEEDNDHIGAWGLWAATVLVLFAAFLGEFHRDILNWSILKANKALMYTNPRSWSRSTREQPMERLSHISSHMQGSIMMSEKPVTHHHRPTIASIGRYVWEWIIYDLKNARDIARHEYLLLKLAWTNPEQEPPDRKHRPKPNIPWNRAGVVQQDGYNQIPDVESGPAERQRERFRPGLAPGGKIAQRAINNIGLGRHVNLGPASPPVSQDPIPLSPLPPTGVSSPRHAVTFAYSTTHEDRPSIGRTLTSPTMIGASVVPAADITSPTLSFPSPSLSQGTLSPGLPSRPESLRPLLSPGLGIEREDDVGERRGGGR